jgi:NAD(P)-dependent dehydrogenase (short-subunit alcohol dehydrogenase family)
MDLHLMGKVAWITGGSGGIGSAIAAALAAEGVDVALTGRTPESLEATAQQISNATGRRAIAVPADVAETAAVQAAAAQIAEQLGGIDILVNCAGKPGGKANGALETVSDEALLQDLNEKFVGALRTSQAAAPYMRERGWGRMIHVSGLNARRSGAYSGGARNIALIQLSGTLADELGQYGITSNVVHPGNTHGQAWTDRFAAQAAARGITPAEVEAEVAAGFATGRLLDPEELAAVVTFLASPLSLPITGESIAIGGGLKGQLTL